MDAVIEALEVNELDTLFDSLLAADHARQETSWALAHCQHPDRPKQVSTSELRAWQQRESVYYQDHRRLARESLAACKTYYHLVREVAEVLPAGVWVRHRDLAIGLRLRYGWGRAAFVDLLIQPWSESLPDLDGQEEEIP